MKILLFTSPTCAWCPYVEETLKRALKNCAEIEIAKIDISKDVEAAEKYDIIALPTILLPNNQRLVGAMSEEELKEHLRRFCFNIF